MKKSRLLNIVLCAELAIAVGVMSYLATKTSQLYKIRPTQYSNELVVNTSNKHKTIIKKNEKQGILDLEKLVQSSPYEEAWVYLPKKQEWIEVGVSESNVIKGDNKLSFKRYFKKLGINNDEIDELYDEGIWTVMRKSKAKVGIAKRELNTLLQNNDEITSYHIHPCNWSPLFEIFPSHKDIAVMIDQSSDFYKHHPNGEYTAKIGSAYGITEYKLTGEGIDYIKNQNLNRFEISRLAKEMHKSIEKVKFDLVETNNYGLKCEMQLKVNNPKLEVNYTPHNQIKFKE
ncbi:hypothetical protein ES703_97592 [subsurface metagenome]